MELKSNISSVITATAATVALINSTMPRHPVPTVLVQPSCHWVIVECRTSPLPFAPNATSTAATVAPAAPTQWADAATTLWNGAVDGGGGGVTTESSAFVTSSSSRGWTTTEDTGSDVEGVLITGDVISYGTSSEDEIAGSDPTEPDTISAESESSPPSWASAGDDGRSVAATESYGRGTEATATDEEEETTVAVEGETTVAEEEETTVAEKEETTVTEKEETTETEEEETTAAEEEATTAAVEEDLARRALAGTEAASAVGGDTWPPKTEARSRRSAEENSNGTHCFRTVCSGGPFNVTDTLYGPSMYQKLTFNARRYYVRRIG